MSWFLAGQWTRSMSCIEIELSQQVKALSGDLLYALEMQRTFPFRQWRPMTTALFTQTQNSYPPRYVDVPYRRLFPSFSFWFCLLVALFSSSLGRNEHGMKTMRLCECRQSDSGAVLVQYRGGGARSVYICYTFPSSIVFFFQTVSPSPISVFFTLQMLCQNRMKILTEVLFLW